MEKLGILDVRILAAGIKHRGIIDEYILERSGISAGTGMILDSLASLMGQKMVRLNDAKSFEVTDSARQLFWNRNVPLRTRILRLLSICPLGPEEIAACLDEEPGMIESSAETLRKGRLIMMSALRDGTKIQKKLEILPRGMQELQAKTSGNAGARDAQIRDMLDVITGLLDAPGICPDARDQIAQKIHDIRLMLDE